VKSPLSHYSPMFANKAWADESQFISYFFCKHSDSVKKKAKGKKQWGRQRGLYSWATEHALDHKLENFAGPIYAKIITYTELTNDERLIWAQFLLSQLVRTPSYMKYEETAKKIHNINSQPMHDRVGCKDCWDLAFVMNRDWCLILAHEDDYFVRTDNPVLQTGFIECPDTCLFYPLSPRLCFVACSMPDSWEAHSHQPAETIGYLAGKGWAHFVNFQLAKCASETLIISPKHDDKIAEIMFSDTLGTYPQPPFSFHVLSNPSSPDNAYNSIRYLMSLADGIEYPEWNSCEVPSFYQRRNEQLLEL
jgi:hypothetical protein